MTKISSVFNEIQLANFLDFKRVKKWYKPKNRKISKSYFNINKIVDISIFLFLNHSLEILF